MNEFAALVDAATARDDETHSGIFFLIQFFMQITKMYSVFLLNLKKKITDCHSLFGRHWKTFFDIFLFNFI